MPALLYCSVTGASLECALTNSGATGMFMDKWTVAKHRFKLQKLKRLLMVKNVDGTVNSGGAITHQVECNVFYKGHMERM